MSRTCDQGCNGCDECTDFEDHRDDQQPATRSPDGADAFLYEIKALDQAWKDVMRVYVVSIVESFRPLIQAVRASQEWRDLERTWNPYHHAKFHRHPKRRALRK